MIDEIEGIIPPEEEKKEPTGVYLKRKEEPSENMGQVAEDLRIDDDFDDDFDEDFDEEFEEDLDDDYFEEDYYEEADEVIEEPEEDYYEESEEVIEEPEEDYFPRIPPARLPATTWCAPGTIRTGCPC